MVTCTMTNLASAPNSAFYGRNTNITTFMGLVLKVRHVVLFSCVKAATLPCNVYNRDHD